MRAWVDIVREFLVSILAHPEGRALCASLTANMRTEQVSILAHPEGRAL